MRTGRANAALLEHVRVDYYDTPTRLIRWPASRARCADADYPALGPERDEEIEQAIQKSDLGLTPANDGKAIRLTIPPLNEERREQLAKPVGKLAEEARVAIRNVPARGQGEGQGPPQARRSPRTTSAGARPSCRSSPTVHPEVDELQKKKEQEILEF